MRALSKNTQAMSAVLGALVFASDVWAADVVTGGRVLEVFAGLAVVLSLVFGLAIVLKRMQMLKPVGQGRLRVLESLSLGTREKLVLVEVDGEAVLLGLSQAGVRALHAPNPGSSLDVQTGLSPSSNYDNIHQAELTRSHQ